MILPTLVAVTIVTVAMAAALCAHSFFAGRVSDDTLPAQSKVFEPALEEDLSILFVSAYGDRKADAHGTFGRFPAPLETPVHIHTHGYRTIVLKGVMSNAFKGETYPLVMHPGTFWSVAPGSERPG